MEQGEEQEEDGYKLKTWLRSKTKHDRLKTMKYSSQKNISVYDVIKFFALIKKKKMN